MKTQGLANLLRRSSTPSRGEYIDSMLRALIKRASAAIPSQCAVCHSWPTQPVCDACVAQFAQPQARCTTCALPVAGGVAHCGRCITSKPPLDACIAAVPYAYPWSGLITRFKFNNSPGWATPFATLIRSTPWAEPALDVADLILPMPLSAQRLQTRGFNQALLLARALAQRVDRPDGSHRADATLLLRIKDTPPQSSLDRAQRLASVQGAFAVAPLQADRLKAKRVVLIDDVMTSGASLFSAASVLRAAGVVHITAMVIARTD